MIKQLILSYGVVKYLYCGTCHTCCIVAAWLTTSISQVYKLTTLLLKLHFV